MTTEHKKLEKKVAALEARIRRLETVTHPQDLILPKTMCGSLP